MYYILEHPGRINLTDGADRPKPRTGLPCQVGINTTALRQALNKRDRFFQLRVPAISQGLS
jgi:hypothetical protein